MAAEIAAGNRRRLSPAGVLAGVDWRFWGALLRYELLLPRRSRLGGVLLVLCCLVGVAAGIGSGLGPSLVAYRAWRLGVLFVGFAGLPLLAVAARLDALSLAVDGIESRPHPAVSRLLWRFAGQCLFLLALYALLLLSAWLAQLLLGGPLPPGSGGRFSLGPPLHAFLAGALPLLYVASLAYCVTILWPNLLSAVVVALYWVLILLGRDYLSRSFDFTLTQNALPYLLLGLGLLALAAQVAHYRARVGRRWSPALLLAAGVLVLGGLAAARSLMLGRHDPPTHPKPLALAMAGQSIRSGFVGGFWLPDQAGRRTGLHDLGSGPLLLAFWSPSYPDSLGSLAHLQTIYQRFGPQGLRVVAICLADDWSVARRFARERGYRFPMLTDTGCHLGDQLADSSPLAEAYEVPDLPAVYLADASRRLVDRRTGLTANMWLELEQQIPGLLAAGTSGTALRLEGPHVAQRPSAEPHPARAVGTARPAEGPQVAERPSAEPHPARVGFHLSPAVGRMQARGTAPGPACGPSVVAPGPACGPSVVARTVAADG